MLNGDFEICSTMLEIFGHYWIIQIRVQAKQENGGAHRQEAVEGGRFCS